MTSPTPAQKMVALTDRVVRLEQFATEIIAATMVGGNALHGPRQRALLKLRCPACSELLDESMPAELETRASA